MLIEVGNILEKNFPGPEAYVTYYKSYSYLLNGSEVEQLDAFFAAEPFPSLNVSNLVLKYYLYIYTVKLIIIINHVISNMNSGL